MTLMRRYSLKGRGGPKEGGHMGRGERYGWKIDGVDTIFSFLCAGQKFSLMDEGRILAKPPSQQVNI